MKRSELYRLVWQQPMMQLAKTYGLSDVGLAKICRKHDIPCPPRGHWAKKASGQEPKQIPLPKLGNDAEIELPEPADTAISSPVLRQTLNHAVANEAKKEMKIEVAETLRGSHPLVSQAHQELQGGQVDRDGLVIRPEKPALDIIVSKTSLRRALLIIDALLKALQQRGYEVEPGPRVRMLGVTLGFGITEAVDIKRSPCEDHDLEGPYSFGHSRFNQERVPSGRLTLRVAEGGAYWLNGCRYTWRDTHKSRLETRLNQFVAGLTELALRSKEHEEEQERLAEQRRQAELRHQEEARQLAEKRKRWKEEKARFDQLLSQADAWHKSKIIRELVEAVRKGRSAEGPIAPGSEVAQWIEWATHHADRLDPLAPSPPSILDEELPPEEEHRTGFHRW